MAPLLGPRFKRLRVWWAMSGKAVQLTVPAARTVRVVTRGIVKSDGHVAEFAASLLSMREALAAPNSELPVTLILRLCKPMSNKHLRVPCAPEKARQRQIQGKSEVQNNAYCMHLRYQPSGKRNPPNTKPTAGFDSPWA